MNKNTLLFLIILLTLLSCTKSVTNPSAISLLQNKWAFEAEYAVLPSGSLEGLGAKPTVSFVTFDSYGNSVTQDTSLSGSVVNVLVPYRLLTDNSTLLFYQNNGTIDTSRIKALTNNLLVFTNISEGQVVFLDSLKR